MTPPFFVGLDVGGTTMKSGVVDETGRLLAPAVSLPTEASRGQEAGLTQMAATIRLAVTGAGLRLNQLAGIGVAVPGEIDIPAGILLNPINLRPWRDVPVRRYLADLFGLPTAFLNDANAAAYGEYWVGAGRAVQSLVMFTLGTGVGGGIVLSTGTGRRGQVLHGEHSHAAELGHILVQAVGGRECACGRHGCLEAYGSATAVVKRTREMLALDKGGSALSDHGELTARQVFDAAVAGDTLAGKVVEETAFFLAAGAVNLMHSVDPDLIVFGGGMIAAGPGFLDRIRHHVHHLAFPILAERTRVCYAELGSDAGFIGAAGCGRLLVQE